MAKHLKKYVPAVLALIALLIFHETIVFKSPGNFTKFYFSKVLFVATVSFALFANAAYYSNRSRIEKRFIVFSLLAFIMLADLFVVTSFSCKRFEMTLNDVLIWLAMGRFVLALGFLETFNHDRWVEKFSNAKALAFAAVFIFILQWALYLIWGFVFEKNVNVIFFFDVVTTTMMLIAIINTISKAPMEVLLDSLGGGVLFFLAQVSHTLLPYSRENLIQSMSIHIFATWLFIAYLNHLNSSIPQMESFHLRRQFNLYAKNLKKIIDKKTIQLREVNDKFMDELMYAKKIQQSLLPENKEMYRDVVVYSGYYPCEQVSGDFYDVYRIDDDHMALYVLDVAGHGISAALMTMFSNNYLKSSDQNLIRFRGLRPEVNLQQFYRAFNKMNFPDEMHMVILYATLDLNTKELTYCSGGLNCMPIRFKKNGEYEFLEASKGFAICKLDGLFTPEYKSAKVQLESGDRVLFYTDGLIDKEKNGMFTIEDLILFLQQYHEVETQTVYEILTEKIATVKEKLDDDITFVLMEV